jgi:hypothetical protein
MHTISACVWLSLLSVMNNCSALQSHWFLRKRFASSLMFRWQCSQNAENHRSVSLCLLHKYDHTEAKCRCNTYSLWTYLTDRLCCLLDLVNSRFLDHCTGWFWAWSRHDADNFLGAFWSVHTLGHLELTDTCTCHIILSWIRQRFKSLLEGQVSALQVTSIVTNHHNSHHDSHGMNLLYKHVDVYGR